MSPDSDLVPERMLSFVSLLSLTGAAPHGGSLSGRTLTVTEALTLRSVRNILNRL